MLLKKTLYTAVHLSLGYTLEIFIIFFDQYILLSYNFYIFFSLSFSFSLIPTLAFLVRNYLNLSKK